MARHGKLFRRAFSSLVDVDSVAYTQDLLLWPRYFTPREQCVLLRAALQKLDRTETKLVRRKMDEYRMHHASLPTSSTSPLEVFLPDDYYPFQEGHYDGVIRHFREMHLSSWPNDIEGLTPILKRLYELCPTSKVQTHLLHLASYGEILPHIDNTSASGSWIIGVSLGDERTLRMEDTDSNSPRGLLDISLPSGSVYLQKDSMRFQYKHAIVKEKRFRPSDSRLEQRLSIMIRDLPPFPA